MGVPGDPRSHVADGFCCFAVHQGKRAIVAGTTSMEEKYEIANRRGATFHVFVQSDGGPFQRVLEVADRLFVSVLWPLAVSGN